MEQQPAKNDSVQETGEVKKEKSSVFRRKALDRISSPEQLNDYVRVASPRMWVVLIAVVVLLAGALVWGIFGTIESTVYGVVIVENGNSTLFVSKDIASIISAGDIVYIKNMSVEVISVSAEPFSMTSVFPEYARSLGGFSLGEWVCAVELEKTPLADGIYTAEVAEEILSPISLLTNTD